MSIITARDVTWSIKGRAIVDGVDLDAHAGRVLGLLGPNGSGKTSFLRLLAGLRAMDAGSIAYDGTNVHDFPRRALAQRLAVVEQDTTANDDLTVEQVVALGRTPFRGRFDSLNTHDNQAIDAALRRTDTTDKRTRHWNSLSGGEKQRVQLARALAQEPREILLDEPTNHLDIRHQLELLELLSDLDVTVVIALHDLNLAARYCDELVILNHGKVVTAGSPDAVLTSDLIRKVYEVDSRIDRELSTGSLRVTYLGVHQQPGHSSS